MAPKKKAAGGAGAKKKEPEAREPPHDPAWERSVQSGVWQRPVDALPGAPPLPAACCLLLPWEGFNFPCFTCLSAAAIFV